MSIRVAYEEVKKNPAIKNAVWSGNGTKVNRKCDFVSKYVIF